MCSPFQLFEAGDVIYTDGCVDEVLDAVQGNLLLVGGIALGVAVMQVGVYWLIVPWEIFEWNFRIYIFKPILVIEGWGMSHDVVLGGMSLAFTNDKSKLIQVMAWCH